MAEFTARERTQAILTLAVAGNEMGAAQLLRSDPDPGQLLPVLIGLCASQIHAVAAKLEMDPADYWAVVISRWVT